MQKNLPSMLSNNVVSRRQALTRIGASVVSGLVASSALAAAGGKRKVVVWSERTAPKNMYPNDINGAIAEGLKSSLEGWDIVTADIDQPEQGCPDSLLNSAD